MHKSSVRQKKSEVRFGFGKKFLVRSFPTSQPNKASYKEQALATHYRECHPGMPPSLSFKLLHTEPNTIMRKIHEALIILNIKPSNE